MPKTTVPTTGYDDAGNATVYDLAPGEVLPPGVHPTPPPGTHPHERELAAKVSVEPVKWEDDAGRTWIKPEPHPLDIPEILKRKRGRPPKPKANPWPAPDGN